MYAATSAIAYPRRAARRWCFALPAALLLASCASLHHAGIDLRTTAAPVELQLLAARARSGDKHAQLELGTLYEEGRGTPVDLARARQLYAVAGADSGGDMPIWSPPVGNAPGRIIWISTGPQVSGLPLARERLARLNARTQ